MFDRTTLTAVNDVQRLQILDATGGTYTLTFTANLAPSNVVAAVVAPPGPPVGTLPIGTYFYKVTAITAKGETVASPEVSADVTVANSAVHLTWTGVFGATGYRVYRGTTSGGEDHWSPAAGTTFDSINTGGTNGSPPSSSTVKGPATKG